MDLELNRPWRHKMPLCVALLVALITASAFADDKGCECIDRVGNVDCDYLDEVTMGDLYRLIDHLFITYSPVPNPQEANCDDDPACDITLGDLTRLIDHLFISYEPLPWCPRPLNHPPVSTTLTNPDTVFINAASAASPGAPVFFRWEANDDLDHPYIPAEVACRWRLYGPYDSAAYQHITDSFMVRVLVRPDGELHRCGETPPATFVICDTSYSGGQQVIACDTVLVDTITQSSDYGRLDTLLDIDCAAFGGSSEFNRIVDSSDIFGSPWTFETSGLFHDVFAAHPNDSTVQARFVFWLQARDPDDTTLLEPAPDFLGVRVIDAQHERPVLVLDFTKSAMTNQPPHATRRGQWDTTLTGWLATRPDLPDTFDLARDYVRVATVSENGLLLSLLKYRALVLVNDEAESSTWGSQPPSQGKNEIVHRAIIEGGVNASLWMRVPLGSFTGTAAYSTTTAMPVYASTWGVTSVVCSAWLRSASVDDIRIEDFVGAASGSPGLPDLVVDSSRLHSLYRWPEVLGIGWDSSLAALPEVDFMSVTPQAEVLYTYRSLYEEGHPQGTAYDFDGLPVMVRLDAGDFRTVHSLFTPLAFEQEAAQEMVRAVLDWLTDQPVTKQTEK